jgi:prepilin-type N-terminal cleavage/methylation domain-containing protein
MRSERAFTLIEVIVAMVLMAIAVALVCYGVVSALNSSSKARTGAVSDAAMSRVSQQFSADIAAAES